MFSDSNVNSNLEGITAVGKKVGLGVIIVGEPDVTPNCVNCSEGIMVDAIEVFVGSKEDEVDPQLVNSKKITDADKDTKIACNRSLFFNMPLTIILIYFIIYPYRHIFTHET
jgi:hypothetical protein